MARLRQCFFFTLILLSAALAGAQEADVIVSKSGPSQAAAGSDVPYDVTLFNLGPDDATSVVLTDNIPTGMTFVSATQNSGPAASCSTPAAGATIGTISCPIATLPNESSATFTFVFNIPPATAPGTFFTNVANVASPVDTNDENNSASAVTSTPPPPQSDASISKSGPGSAGPDTDVVYTITVINGGPDEAPNVTWSDTLPGTMTFVSLMQNSGPAMTCSTGTTVSCSAAPFAAGATATFTLTGHIPAGTPPGTSFSNTATVTAPNDPNGENNSSGTLLTTSSVDVAVNKSGPAIVAAGDDITYTITVSKTGADIAENVSLTDALPPDTTFVSLMQNSGPTASCSTPQAGENGTVVCNFPPLPGSASAVFTLVVTAGNTSSVTNTASVATTSFDIDDSNDESSATTTVTPLADMGVTKSGPAAVTSGTTITYTVTVTNNGPTGAANVTLTDVLPPNTTFVSANQTAGPAFNCGHAAGTVTCTIATFPLGATATFSFVFNVDASVPNGNTISNTANVSATTADPNGGNNSSTSDATVAPTADLVVTKSGPSNVTVTNNATYTVGVTNNGPSDAANVTLTDQLPPNTTFVSANQTSGPAFNCAHAAGTITCTIASLAAGASATFEFVVQVSPDARSPLTNAASATSSTVDPNPSNSSASTSAAVTALPGTPTLSTLGLALLAIALIWTAVTRVTAL